MGPGTEKPLAGGRISYLFLDVHDVEGMLAFYAETLGFTTLSHEAGRFAFVRLEAAGLQLALYAGRTGSVAEKPNWLLAIDVPELEVAVARLKQAGIAVGPIEAVPFGRAMKFRDPEGNVLELHEPD